jgi:hypothetical protein
MLPNRKAYLFALFLLNAILGFSASDEQYSTKYNVEKDNFFSFSQFTRGFNSDSLKNTLDLLEKKERVNWTRKDSLIFASTSMNTGNLNLSGYYFNHVRVSIKDGKFWWDAVIQKLLTEEYEEGLKEIRDEYPGILQYSKVYFLIAIFEAKIALKRDQKWIKKHDVLNWTVDTSLVFPNKNSEEFERIVLKPLYALDDLLHLLLHHIHDEDQVIAKVCLEMGKVLEAHVSLTQAYIAYSLGRNFDKWNKEILQKIKSTKVLMSEKHYKIPIFRRYLPRIEKWRFEYAVLKEKIILQKNDTLNKKDPELLRPKEEPMLPFNPELIKVIGILLVFLIILFFVKSRKR